MWNDRLDVGVRAIQSLKFGKKKIGRVGHLGAGKKNAQRKKGPACTATPENRPGGGRASVGGGGELHKERSPFLASFFDQERGNAPVTSLSACQDVLLPHPGSEAEKRTRKSWGWPSWTARRKKKKTHSGEGNSSVRTITTSVKKFEPGKGSIPWKSKGGLYWLLLAGEKKRRARRKKGGGTFA